MKHVLFKKVICGILNFLPENIKNSLLYYYILKKYKIKYTKMLAVHKNNPLTKSPRFYPYSAVLKTEQEYINAIKEIESIGLLPYEGCIQKNWDSLAALSIILSHIDRNASILDAGGEFYSTILPWLAAYGYTNLRCINISFKKRVELGDILYESGDIAHTKFGNNSFDAITYLSVIEHVGDAELCFKEISKILKPNGFLIISTDYWPTPINTKDKVAFGAPWRIFDRTSILRVIDIAKKYNFNLVGNIDLEAKDKVVRWNDRDFTFIYFVLQKMINK